MTVALVLVPQSLAYAQLAGMPAYRGLYAAALPPLAAAFIASSPYLQTGPVALTSLLTFGALSTLAPPGSGEYVSLGILLALLVGIARLLVGLLRAGVIAYLVSEPMLLGFTPAAAILIVASQLPTVAGVAPGGDGILDRAFSTIGSPASWEVASVALAAGTIALMVVGPAVHRLFPSAFIAVAAGIAFGAAANYDGTTVGSIPGRLPPFSLDFPWQELPKLVIPATIIALVGFVEASSIARTFAARDRRRWDTNREFESQGVANIAAAVSGGFPVGGSFSRSALNRQSGAKTRWSGAVTGLVVLAFLPLAGVLSRLPTAVLGAVVIGAVVGLVRPLPYLRLARLSRPQFAVATTTFVLTLALAPRIEWAVLVGITLSVGVHLWRELSLEVPSWTEGATLHLRPRGVIWFGTASRLEDQFVELMAQHPESSSLTVHLDGLGRIDTSGALALRGLLRRAHEAGLTVEIADVRPRWRGLVEHVIEREDDPLGR